VVTYAKVPVQIVEVTFIIKSVRRSVTNFLFVVIDAKAQLVEDVAYVLTCAILDVLILRVIIHAKKSVRCVQNHATGSACITNVQKGVSKYVIAQCAMKGA
jgi:hypothetical protein